MSYWVYRLCVCRRWRHNLDNLLCLWPVVLFPEDSVCSSYRLSLVFKILMCVFKLACFSQAMPVPDLPLLLQISYHFYKLFIKYLYLLYLYLYSLFPFASYVPNIYTIKTSQLILVPFILHVYISTQVCLHSNTDVLQVH